MKSLSTFLLLLWSVSFMFGIGDTITVQAFSFSDPSPEGWNTQYKKTVEFPDINTEYYKIIMVQTLKCDKSTKADTFPCGEWDYIWHTKIIIPKENSNDTFCIGSFVTPYGKRLNLGGETGWVWEYDITDYSPILKGKADVISGNNQELLDLKFLFIIGKPVRNVLSVENIYPFGVYKYEHLSNDSILKTKEIILNINASAYMLRAIISGHGHNGPRNCCEWESKTHTYYSNKEVLFRWNVWKDCGFNAIYPQGGTWPFDRAGWCPGTKVDEYDFELTKKIKPGDTLQFDYGIEPYSDNGEKDGEFQMTHQLFSYGIPNYQTDCAIIDIITPANKQEYTRLNPSCSNPVIIIQNTGNNILKRVNILYGLHSGEKSTFIWNGRLDFLEKETITLPIPDLSKLSDEQIFEVQITKVNEIIDENSLNNILVSKVKKPVVLPKEFIISVKTNNINRSVENKTIISNSTGQVLYLFDKYTDDKENFHQIKLDPGCYEFLFSDDMEDGIMQHWWYWNTEKEKVGVSGKVKILSNDKNDELLSFPSDFGQELRLNFIVE